MAKEEVMEKGFFEAAWDGICAAPTESKIVAGVAAGVVAIGVGIGSFFGGKAFAEHAAKFDPTKEDGNKEEAKQEEQPQPEQNAQQQQAQQTAA